VSVGFFFPVGFCFPLTKEGSGWDRGPGETVERDLLGSFFLSYFLSYFLSFFAPFLVGSLFPFRLILYTTTDGMEVVVVDMARHSTM
jgi:hypothetical protein